MIRYALTCPEGHAFEAWFAGSKAFETQRKRGLLECPACGSIEVDRALMAPAVSTARGREGRQAMAAAETAAAAEAAPAASAGKAEGGGGEAVRLAANVPGKQEVIAALRQLRKQVTENAEYVGKRFPEEARRIHYEEAEKRGIYGEASREDAEALADEGIEFHPLPVLPEDKN